MDVDEKIPIENYNYFDYFSLVEFLFRSDWFLIELGRKLMNKNDSDLLNILVLNKKINERATIVFRKHFLNFQLQNEVIQLTKEKDFKKIQQIFTLFYNSLNPNINFTYESKSQIPRCVHDQKVMSTLSEKQCICAKNKQTVHLAVIAYRNGFECLSKLLLFHPRMDLTTTKWEMHELFNWSSGKGYFEILEFILENSQEGIKLKANPNLKPNNALTIPQDIDFKDFKFETDNPPSPILYAQQHEFSTNTGYSLTNLDWEFATASAIYHGRENVLERLLNGIESKYLEIKVSELNFVCLSLCAKHGVDGPKFFKLYLNSSLCEIDFSEMEHLEILDEICKYQLKSKYLQIVLDFIFKNAKEMKKNDAFQFNSSQISEIVHSLFENELCEKENATTALKFVYSVGLLSEFQRLLCEREWSDCDLMELLEHIPMVDFSNISNHKDIIQLTLDRLKTSVSGNKAFYLMDYLSELQSPSMFELVWNHKRISLSQEWKNQFLLQNIDKFNEELVESLLPYCNFNKIGPEDQWKEEMLQNVLLSICKHCSSSFFRLLNIFPNLNLSLNNNEAFEVFIAKNKESGPSRMKMFEKFEKSIRFENENQRSKIASIASQNTFANLVPNILHIKLLNEI